MGGYILFSMDGFGDIHSWRRKAGTDQGRSARDNAADLSGKTPEGLVVSSK